MFNENFAMSLWEKYFWNQGTWKSVQALLLSDNDKSHDNMVNVVHLDFIQIIEHKSYRTGPVFFAILIPSESAKSVFFSHNFCKKFQSKFFTIF